MLKLGGGRARSARRHSLLTAARDPFCTAGYFGTAGEAVEGAGLRLGETVCVPGLEDRTAALDALLAAETALLAGGDRPVPATRYGPATA